MRKYSLTTSCFVCLLLLFIKIGNAQETKIIGKWIGDFGKKKITIVIDEIQNDTIYGYNVVGKNQRKIKGIYKTLDGIITAKLNEPGDDKYDGLFTISFVSNKKANGNWKMFKGSSYKNFTLKKEIVTIEKNESLDLVGKWIGITDRYNNKLKLRIDKIENRSIYGFLTIEEVVSDFKFTGTIETDNTITGKMINYSKNSTRKVTERDWARGKDIKMIFDNSTKEFSFNWIGSTIRNITLKKLNNDKKSLLVGLKGNWEGEMKNRNYGTSNISLTILKVTKDSVFGYTKMKVEKGKSRKMFFGGKIEITENDMTIFPTIYSAETEDSSFKKYQKNTNYVNFMYLKQKIKGAFVTKDVIFDLELKKFNRIQQSPNKNKLIENRISILETKTNELSTLFNVILNKGVLTPYGTIKKANQLMLDMDNWRKQNPIPNDKRLLTIEQEERMDKIKDFIIFSSTNTKLLKLLGK